MADAGDKIYKETIDTFYGGIADDARIQKPEVFQLSQHFDYLTNPKRLTPYRRMVADVDSTSKAYKIDSFAYENSAIWGLGRKSGGTKNKVYTKSAAASFGAWAAASSGEAATSNAFDHACMIAFHDRAYFDAALTIDSYGTLDPSGTYTEPAYSPGGQVNAQGIITSDDLLVIPLLASLAVKDGAGSGPTDTWSVPISFPNNRQIRDLCEWGEFVAVGMHPGGGYNGAIGSKVFLWDKANADPSHVIDWGEGHLLILDDIEGTLIGVSVVGYGEEGIIKQKLVVRQYVGGNEAQVIFEIEGDSGQNLYIWPNKAKIRDSNRLLFPITITKDGNTYVQMACVGRKKAGYPWTFSLDRVLENNSESAGTVSSVYGAFKLGQSMFIAYNNDGSINRTDQTANFPTATYISQKRDGSALVGDAKRRKKALVMAGVLTAPLSTGQAVSLYYRHDGGAWTLIRTYTYGDDAAATPPVVPANCGFEAGRDSNGNDFENFREVEFKALSTGGAEITAIIFAWKFAGAGLISE